jgi:hypothetical protein
MVWEESSRSHLRPFACSMWQVISAAASAVDVNLLSSDEQAIDLYTAMTATNQSLLSMHTENGDPFYFFSILIRISSS